jgi:Protein of unknown function (DUF2786)
VDHVEKSVGNALRVREESDYIHSINPVFVTYRSKHERENRVPSINRGRNEVLKGLPDKAKIAGKITRLDNGLYVEGVLTNYGKKGQLYGGKRMAFPEGWPIKSRDLYRLDFTPFDGTPVEAEAVVEPPEPPPIAEHPRARPRRFDAERQMRSVNMDVIIRRIRKCLILARDGRTNPKEAASAAEQARKMLDRYNLTEAQIDAHAIAE